MAALRDHGAGRPPRLLAASTARWRRRACTPAGCVTSSQTTASWVADLRGDAAPLGDGHRGAVHVALQAGRASTSRSTSGPAADQPPTTRPRCGGATSGCTAPTMRDHAALARPLRPRARPDRGGVARRPARHGATRSPRPTSSRPAGSPTCVAAGLPDRRPPVAASHVGGAATAPPATGAGAGGDAADEPATGRRGRRRAGRAGRGPAPGRRPAPTSSCSRPATGSAGAPRAAHTADGTPVELGGQWIGPTQNRMYELVAELGLETFPTYNDGEHVVAARRPAPAGMALAPGRRAEAQPVRAGRPRPGPAPASTRAAPHACRSTSRGARRTPRDLDGQTFETWIRRNLRTAAGPGLLPDRHRGGVLGRDAPTCPRCTPLFYAHSGTDLETLLSVDRGAQQDRIVGRLDPHQRAHGRRSSATGSGSACRCAASTTTTTASRVDAPATGEVVEADHVDRHPAADAGRPPRVRPGAAVVARPAHPAAARRIGHQAATPSTTSRSGGPTG